VHVRAFYDSDGNGVGDFRGLTQKLGYLKDLGVTAVWLLPFYPSPLRDDGYDIADYCDVHPLYGTLADFNRFLREAHRLGLRVITELVLNHTSDQHPWFQRARRAKPGSRWRNFYVWSDTPERYRDARIIFKDVEISNWSWDHTAQAYYWHRFFSHQPDLNYDNPEVHEALFKVLDFWLGLGVDGLRLDAVPYLYEREGTNCENLPETHQFLKLLRAHVDGKYRDRMLLAEANQWPEDAVAYFGQGRGDECHMAFHFPLMPRLFMALRMEDRHPVVDILEQTPPLPESGQWALFLRNHDELTLEMVTDEERDYMYRMYAQTHQARLNLGIRRRLAPLLGNDRKRIELLNALLFSLPGTPVVYYGDEIGLGENIYLGDRNGVRTPMQWNSDKNAGFSRANPQSLYLPIILDPAYHYEAVNVETQLANPHSLLWWMRRMLALRKRWRALGEGKCEFLQPDNRKILSYVLRFGEEIILVVANLSRFVQPVHLDLSSFRRSVPVELFGGNELPEITERPYFLTLGPHAFYWFSLGAPGEQPLAAPGGAEKRVVVKDNWQELFSARLRLRLETLLVDYLRRQPWFETKRRILRVALKETISLPLGDGCEARLNFAAVEFVGGDTDLYHVPLAYVSGAEADRLLAERAGRVVAEVRVGLEGEAGVLVDAMVLPAFGRALLQLIAQRLRLKSAEGEVEGSRMAASRLLLSQALAMTPEIVRFERHNSLLQFGDKIILKLYRRLEAGVHPEVELGRWLAAQAFANASRLAGALDYRDAAAAGTTLAVAHEFVPYAKDAWDYTLDALGRYYDRVSSWVAQGVAAPATPLEALRLLQQGIPSDASDRIGTFLESARLLGQRTAELHLALAAGQEKDAVPEPFTPHYQRGLFQSMRNVTIRNLRRLRARSGSLAPDLQPLARKVGELEPVILERFRSVLESRIDAKRIRIHGDCHLSQVLWTGKDFIFFDLEGEARQPLSERRIKRSPLRDAAALVRAFHYAAHAGWHRHVEQGCIGTDKFSLCEPWIRYWNVWVGTAYLKAYFQRLQGSGLLPGAENELRDLMRMYLLFRVITELGDEDIQGSPALRIPLRAAIFLADGSPS
jgi:maltose alpha-D-glucosyltransferase/alpha-amylase